MLLVLDPPLLMVPLMAEALVKLWVEVLVLVLRLLEVLQLLKVSVGA